MADKDCQVVRSTQRWEKKTTTTWTKLKKKKKSKTSLSLPVCVYEIERFSGQEETYSKGSSNSGSAPSGMKDKQRGFQDACVASCHDESGGFNCRGQRCIRGTSSLILEWHEWLPWLSYHAAGLPEFIAVLLIFQNRGKRSLCCLQNSLIARSDACCVLWERDAVEDYSPARLYPDFCSNNKVSSTSGDHLLCHLK